MQTTKTIVLDVPAPRGTFPLRHLEAYVQACLSRYADKPGMTVAELSQLEQDRKSMMTTISGDTMSTTIEKTLTYTEQLADDLERATAGLLSLRELYDENGQLKTGPDGKVPKDVLKKLRAVVWADYVRPVSGSGVEGTSAPPAGPAVPNVAPTPEEIAAQQEQAQRDEWMRFVQESGFGWDLNKADNIKALKQQATNMGIPWEKAAGWIGIAAE